MYLLSIDPSINSLGWAIFNLENGELEASGVVHNYIPQSQEIEKRIRGIICNLTVAIWRWLKRVRIVIIEKPHMWGAYKSVASAHSGSLLVLHILVGALFWWASDNKCKLIRVSEWKGQLPKDVTKARMEKKYAKVFKGDDEADAVGLGSWYLERQTKKERKVASNGRNTQTNG